MKDSSLNGLDRFFARSRSFNFKKDETILRPGDPIPGVFFLKRGFVRLYTVSLRGEELTLLIFKSGDIFPISWSVGGVSPQGENRYFLEALTSCELKRVNRRDFLNFIKSNPEALFELTSRLSMRLSGLLIRAESFVFGDAKSRVASILLLCAERFGRKTDSEIEIEVPLTQSDIASFIGVTRETASIEIKKFENKGFIGYHGRLLLIRDKKGLRRQALS